MKFSRRSFTAATLGATLAASSIAHAGSLNPTLARQTPSPVPGSLKWEFPRDENVEALHLTNGVIISVGEETIQAIDASSGSGLWKHDVGTSRPITLAADGVLFLSQEGFTIAFDATSGEEKWRVEDSSSDLLFHTGGVLYLGRGRLALDSASGSELWRSDGVILAATENMVITQGNSLIFVGTDVNTWGEIWRLDVHSALGTTFPNVLHMDLETVIIADDSGVWALATSNGQQLWHKTLDGGFNDSIVSDGLLIGSTDDSVMCLDLTTGQEIWKSPFNGYGIEKFTIANNVVYFYVNGGEALYALSVSDGTEIWSSFPERYYIQAITVHGGSLYVPFFDGWDGVAVFDAEHGTQRWRFDNVRDISTPVLVNESTAYFGGDHSNVYAVVAEPERNPSVKSGSAAATLVETPVRAAPLQSGDIVTTLSADTEVFVSGSSQESGGVTWWPIIAPDGTEGWVDDAMLRGQ